MKVANQTESVQASRLVSLPTTKENARIRA